MGPLIRVRHGSPAWSAVCGSHVERVRDQCCFHVIRDGPAGHGTDVGLNNDREVHLAGLGGCSEMSMHHNLSGRSGWSARFTR